MQLRKAISSWISRQTKSNTDNKNEKCRNNYNAYNIVFIIQVQDNGEGMEREKVQEIMENIKNEEQSDSDSTGIGLENVNKRLELYYKKENLFKIDSDGAMCGTTATIIIPKEEEVF